jgi:hypothetical protein
MNDGFALSPVELQKAQTIAELRECNSFTASYGLYLSDKQIQVLTERRIAALKDTGRIEFGQGILKKLVTAFCDSPYLTQQNYEDSIIELQDSFYYFKNESMDQIPDDDLIFYMKRHFDGRCQGSIDYLSSTTLEDLCRNTRYGYETDDIDPYGPLF